MPGGDMSVRVLLGYRVDVLADESLRLTKIADRCGLHLIHGNLLCSWDVLATPRFSLLSPFCRTIRLCGTLRSGNMVSENQRSAEPELRYCYSLTALEADRRRRVVLRPARERDGVGGRSEILQVARPAAIFTVA